MGELEDAEVRIVEISSEDMLRLAKFAQIHERFIRDEVFFIRGEGVEDMVRVSRELASSIGMLANQSVIEVNETEHRVLELSRGLLAA
ncbi:MAG: hypothetical protein A3E94_02955 [Candidatus Zambryskibacteria bacterium RIFCSPHIGHO2_12_FULL_44_12b]|nr:MAG: hypothetical protein A3E94_02955 [Candidatus Zambryskibacteria bacterium RIFCSPHIGHO2_12_FULL_44_12b]